MNKIILTVLLLALVGCAGQMLPGRIYTASSSRILQFNIETSRGNGKMDAVDSATGENFKGEYSGFYKGQDAVFGTITLIRPPTGANAYGILVGDKGTTIRLYFEIKPGLRPTGYGVGSDQDGQKYEAFF